MPAAQCVHAVEPSTLWNAPGVHAAQLELPIVADIVPKEHATGCAEAEGHAAPAGHLTHSSTLGRAERLLYVPAAHLQDRRRGGGGVKDVQAKEGGCLED